MHVTSLYVLLAISWVARLAQSAGRNRTSGTTSDVWDRGTFANPSSNARPKVRYWAPDAYIDEDRAKFDIEELASMYSLYSDTSSQRPMVDTMFRCWFRRI